MPRSKREQQDPTGQASRRRQAAGVIVARLRAANVDIVRLLGRLTYRRRTVPVVVNAEQTVYDYDLTPEEQAALAAAILAVLAAELGTTGDQPPPNWFWLSDIETAHRAGVQAELVQFNQLIAAAAVAGVVTRFGLKPQRVPAEAVQVAAPVNTSRRKAEQRAYTGVKGLASATAADVMRTVERGIAAGSSPAQIAQAIGERFEVAEFKAKRIAVTEVNRANNDGHMAATQAAADSSGMDAAVVHISALLPTTRPHHAARHGNVYSVEDQNAWWDEGANRINCHCSVRSALVAPDGQVVSTEFRDELRAERPQFKLIVEGPRYADEG